MVSRVAEGLAVATTAAALEAAAKATGAAETGEGVRGREGGRNRARRPTPRKVRSCTPEGRHV